MATKNKEARKSLVAAIAELQEAVETLEGASAAITANLSVISTATTNLREAETTVYCLASRLRRMCEASKRGRSPQKRPTGTKPAGRKFVAGPLSPLSQWYPRKPKSSLRKRVSRKPSGKDKLFNNDDLPF